MASYCRFSFYLTYVACLHSQILDFYRALDLTKKLFYFLNFIHLFFLILNLIFKKNNMLINMCSRKLSLYKYSSSAIYTTLWAQDCKSNTDKIDYTGITKRQKVDNIFWGGKQNQQKIKILIKKNKKNYKIKKIK